MMRPDPPSLPAIPSRLADLDAWRARHGFSREAARRRYAQAAIAAGIALTPALRQSLVFKGGNALDFALSVNRSTIDLDFSFDHTSESMVAIPEEIERYLSAGCEQAALRQEMSLAVHRVRQHPPGPDRTFVTFTSRIGYALPDEVALRERMAQGRPSPNIVPVEISINEPICAESTFSPGAGLPSLRISSIGGHRRREAARPDPTGPSQSAATTGPTRYRRDSPGHTARPGDDRVIPPDQGRGPGRPRITHRLLRPGTCPARPDRLRRVGHDNTGPVHPVRAGAG